MKTEKQLFFKGYTKALVVAPLVAMSMTYALAQTSPAQPNAGSLLRENKPPVLVPPHQGKIVLPENHSTAARASSATGQVRLKGFRFSGNKSISSKKLLKELPEKYTSGSEFSVGIPDVNAIAAKLTRYYREHGHLSALVYAGPQEFRDMILTLTVLEGKVGEAVVDNRTENYKDELLQGFLKSNLCGNDSDRCQGESVSTKSIERVAGIISDLPGLGVVSTVLSPGKAVGSSNLGFKVARGEKYAGRISGDNFGNKHTGRERLQGQLYLNNLLGWGDQIDLDALTSGSGVISGGIGYSQPIGYSGLRAGIRYSRSQYELGGVFSALNAKGTSDTISPYLSYPIIRSREYNLYFLASYDYKSLKDEVGNGISDSHKEADGYSASLSGDMTDRMYGTSFSGYGLTYSGGDIKQKKDTAAQSADDSSLGTYSKIAYNIFRDQHLVSLFGGHRVSLYGSYYGQTTSDNLDSSEKLGLGGPSGVRAYSTGASAGDISRVGNIELRYAMPIVQNNYLTLSLFRDRGWSKNKLEDNSGVTDDNRRSLSGNGVSLNLVKPGLYSVRATYAKQDTSSPASVSDDKDEYFWVQGSLFF